MTGDMLPGFSAPQLGPRRWQIITRDDGVRIVEAVGFRVDHGALVMVLAVGNVMALAPGQWIEVAPAGEQRAPARDEGGRR